MLNSDRFLDAFNTIERYVRRSAGVGPTEPFTSAAHRASKSDANVRHYLDTLLEYAQLRNAIVHGPRGERVLAEPNDCVVAEIEKIAAHLTAPPSVTDFMNRNVITLQSTAPLSQAIRVFRDETFSQIPVYTGKKFTGLLTTTAVVRWLGKQIDGGQVNLEQVTVQDVLDATGNEKRYLFMSRQASAFDVIEAFEKFQRSGKRLRAVLVTETGRPDQALLGILTAWDLQAVYQALESGISMPEPPEE